MEIFDYIFSFKNCSHIEVGDGLISIHTDSKSEIVNCTNHQILELSKDEYCINAKNEYFLICNHKSKTYYILNKRKETIVTIKTWCLTVLEHRDLIVYFDNDLYEICILDFAGKKLLSLNYEYASSFKSAHQISDYIICLEFYPNFELEFYPDFENSKFDNGNRNKCVVINISNNEILLQGEYVDGCDETVVADATYFEFPVKLPMKDWNYHGCENEIRFIPTIKFTLAEPYLDDDKLEFNRHVEFCDFYGNLVKRTEFSEISDQQGRYYIVKKDGHGNNDDTYGVLDLSLEPFLPCCFPKLIIEDGKIKMEETSWSDWSSKELETISKRFWAKSKNGDSILLPYLYCSCNEEEIHTENDQLLFAHKYDETGEYYEGIINTKGEEILPAIYHTICRIRKNLYQGIIKSGNSSKSQVLYIHENEVVVRGQYLKVEGRYINDEYRIVRVFDTGSNSHVRLGVIDSKGLEIVPPIYDYVYYPSEGRITYIKKGVAGWIDLSDMSTHEYPKYSVIKPFLDGVAVVSIGKVKIRSVSENNMGTGWNNEENSPTYTTYLADDIYGEMRIRYEYMEHKEGMIDINGKMIAEPIYNEIIRNKRNQNFLIVKFQKLYGAIDKYGHLLIPIKYISYYTNPDNNDNYEGLSCTFEDKENVDFYNADGDLLGTEDKKSYYWGNCEIYDNDEDYNYERDTYYALGGNDYDEWHNKDGNLDDMMDGMGH